MLYRKDIIKKCDGEHSDEKNEGETVEDLPASSIGILGNADRR